MKKKFLFLSVFLFFALSCSSGLLKYEKAKEEFKNDEFDRQVKIVEPEEDKNQATVLAPTPAVTEPEPKVSVKPVAKKSSKKKTPSSKTKTTKSKAAAQQLAAKPLTRQPDIEDSEGFNNIRRPPVDPFHVGEKIIHEISYLGATAGTLSLTVNPYAIVNGRKAYNFHISIKSSSFFSNIYAVDDEVTTYLDYENLVPGAFKLNIRDSGQVKEARAFFDFNTLTANYWEHRYTEKNGHEEKKMNWSILPYSQNAFSAIFYMRVFKFEVGKEYSFRVADDGKNVVFKAKVLEKIKLHTDAGDFNAIKMKAEIVSRGNLAKASDFYMWVSDDDHKYILRIEVKLPIGSLVSEATEIKEGD